MAAVAASVHSVSCQAAYHSGDPGQYEMPPLVVPPQPVHGVNRRTIVARVWLVSVMPLPPNIVVSAPPSVVPQNGMNASEKTTCATTMTGNTAPAPGNRSQRDAATPSS